ncbi:MAG: hypothetical protein ACKN9W_03865 [Methylococcus sp.]
MSLQALVELFAPPTPPTPAEPTEAPGFREQFTARQWAAMERHPEILEALRLAHAFGLLRAAGIAPDHYTGQTVCRSCGPVPIWHGAPAHVQGCPWCGNRTAGLPIPKVTHRPAMEGGGGGPVAPCGHDQDLLNGSTSTEKH